MHLISNAPLPYNRQSLHYNLTMSIREYFSPKGLEEAADLALNSPLPARFFAGGTDIMIQMMGEKTPQTRLISLKDIDSDDQEIFAGPCAGFWHGGFSLHTEYGNHRRKCLQCFPFC
jgi:CO/xanthine dehydrogenase FAD-binding subunit